MSTVERSVHEKKDGERAGVVDLTGVLLKSYMVFAPPNSWAIQLSM
jgi:hypothetical protein